MEQSLKILGVLRQSLAFASGGKLSHTVASDQMQNESRVQADAKLAMAMLWLLGVKWGVAHPVFARLNIWCS